MEPYKELFKIAQNLEDLASESDNDDISLTLQSLDRAAYKWANSFSGSCLGYHSRVYYRDFKTPPAGANFSPEWGLKELSYTDLGSRGEWREYQFEYVQSCIFKSAGNPDLTRSFELRLKLNEIFDRTKSEIESILLTEESKQSDSFLERLIYELRTLHPVSKADVVDQLLPKGQIMTRDGLAMSQGIQTPPHLDIVAEIMSIRQSVGICRASSTIARKAASHLERKIRGKRVSDRVGTNVFIGHGRSPQWRELKDFLQDRVNLPWDEFNRVPVAGVTNITRLSEMLDAAAIAFLIMTAEDEMSDGSAQARMNVIHEAGLFQGRLGFTKAIVLLEDGCSEFSNINGLGQIRYPKGRIAAVFEEVRLVLEREGLIPDAAR